jgi:hypothetical protein
MSIFAAAAAILAKIKGIGGVFAGMGSVVIGAVKYVLLWLLKSVVGKAIIKAVVKIAAMGFLLYALAYADMLPRSPLRPVLILITVLRNQIPYVNYVSYFVPVDPILLTMATWVSAIFSFHVVKVILRMSRIIK